MLKKIRLVIVCSIVTVNNYAQVNCEFTSAKSRAQFVKETDSCIAIAVHTSITDTTTAIWNKAIWGIQVRRLKNTNYVPVFKKQLLQLPKATSNMQRNFLEMIYGYNTTIFNKEIQTILPKLISTKAQCIAAQYLLRNGIQINRTIFIHRLASDTTLTRADKTRLSILLENTVGNKPAFTQTISVIKSFLNPKFAPGKTIAVSIQRSNRNYAGLVIIRNGNGKLMVDSNTNIIAIPQIARSMSGLPYYITNGNTPQGVFVMDSLGVSKNKYIGPTANVQIRLPFNESTVQEFSYGKLTDTNFTIQNYYAALPLVAQNYAPMAEAYLAGKCLRTEMIAHGTTVNPEYYKNTTYYPQTPTLGCLCTKELWNTKGERIYSDQQRLTNALVQAGGAIGYYVVIDIDDAPKDVDLKDVFKVINE